LLPFHKKGNPTFVKNVPKVFAMRRINLVIISVALFNVTISWSQNKAIDSLKLVLSKAKNDIDKAQLLNALADEYKTTNPKLVKDYATKALQLAEKIKFTVAIGNAYLNLGNAAIVEGNYKLAIFYFGQAQTLFEEAIPNDNKDKDLFSKGLAKAYGSLGIVFSEQSNYAKALQFYLKSVKMYEELNDPEKCAKLYNNIGIVYKSQGSDFKALEYFVKAQKIQEKLHDHNIGITLTNIGNCYVKQKNYPQALSYYDLAQKSLNANPNPRALGELYNNLGFYFKQTKNIAKAKENWAKAISSFESIEDKFGIADTYLLLGELDLEQDNIPNALTNVNKAFSLAKQINVLEQKVIAQKLLSKIFSKKNNASQALYHYQLYTQLKDSLVNEENIRKSIQEEMNFEYEKREAIHKAELEKKEIILQEQSKRNQLQLLFGGLLALLLFGIGFLIYNRVQLKKTLTLQKELAEYEQKALHLQMNPHFVFNCLGSISSFIVQNGTDTAVKYLAKFSKLMRLTLEYSKESLIPIDKEIESLQNYLELEQLRFNNKFTFSIFKDKNIEDDLALPPLLLQPFVENAIIHGVIPKKEMGSIAIEFTLEKENLICSVMDNGIGYHQSKNLKQNSVAAHKSMALDIITKRLEMIEESTKQKTSFSIDELKQNGEIKGTKVELRLPIQYIK
jgi:tetratricopeptide (TPR) repeat protein